MTRRLWRPSSHGEVAIDHTVLSEAFSHNGVRGRWARTVLQWAEHIGATLISHQGSRGRAAHIICNRASGGTRSMIPGTHPGTGFQLLSPETVPKLLRGLYGAALREYELGNASQVERTMALSLGAANLRWEDAMAITIAEVRVAPLFTCHEDLVARAQAMDSPCIFHSYVTDAERAGRRQ